MEKNLNKSPKKEVPKSLSYDFLLSLYMWLKLTNKLKQDNVDVVVRLSWDFSFLSYLEQHEGSKIEMVQLI